MRSAPNDRSKVRLVCFPYAGTGASIFQSWPSWLPRDVDMCAIQLPGREMRFREQPHTSYMPIVEETARALESYLDQPLVLFGYSLGAILAYELAHYLRQAFQTNVTRLIVAARVAPQIIEHRDPFFHTLPDGPFLEQVAKLGGMPQAILQNEELMSFLLPVLRADFQINEMYHYEVRPPLTCDMTVLRGAADPLMTYDQVAQWQDETTGQFCLRTLPGGHFFMLETQKLFTQLIQRDLQKAVRSTI